MRLVRVGPAWASLTLVGVVCGFEASHARADSKKDAAASYKEACDGGSAPGCTHLGDLYKNGIGGLPKDMARAVALYKQACDGGHMQGCSRLGVVYAFGLGVAKDEVRAAALYKQACDGSDMQGCYDLGRAYRFGQGVPKDMARAAALYQQACDGGNAVGCSSLRIMAAVPCIGSVAEYCQGKGGKCPTYDESVERWKTHCKEPGFGTVFAHNCVGVYRSLSGPPTLLFGSREYFDANGQLVAVYEFSDVIDSHCHGSKTFGSIPTCPAKPVITDLCRR